MEKVFRFLLVVYCFGILTGCNKDDRDDTILNMSDLTGKYWFNNRWVGDKYSYVKNDILEVLKFEKNGKISVMDYSGRMEETVGSWSTKNNEIILEYNNGDIELWDVLHSGGDYITAVINQGERRYTAEPGFLQDLTADAFLVNEFVNGNSYRTHIGVSVRGNADIREAALIIPSGDVIPLKNQGYYWCERTPEKGDYFDFDREESKARFYFKIKKSDHVKLSDRIYGTNLEQRTLADFNLNAGNPQGVTTLTTTWNPFPSSLVFYRIEIFDEGMNLGNPYFVSKLQYPGTSKLDIRTNTAGEINRMKEMKQGQKYTIRLSSIIYEPGVDVNNDEYSYTNVQAITYVTKQGIWE